MIQQLLQSLWTELIQFVKDIFQIIFGGWNYQAILGWLPTDIQNAIDIFIIVLFGIVLIKLIRSFIPT